MASGTVASKGQITIPAHVRARLGLRPGSRITFVPTARGYEIPAVRIDQGSQGRRATADPVNQRRRNERDDRLGCLCGLPVIGLDTNVIVRYLVQDDPDQSAAASALIEELTETQPGYVSLVTVSSCTGFCVAPT